jgi:hypothetical protein
VPEGGGEWGGCQLCALPGGGVCGGG